MSRKNFLFMVKHVVCAWSPVGEEEDKIPLSSCDRFRVFSGTEHKDVKWEDSLLTVYFRGDVVSQISTRNKYVLRRDVPYADVEELIRHKGTPDILQVDSDFERRKYTYVEEEIAVIFSFVKNSLYGVEFGDLEITDTSNRELVDVNISADESFEFITKFGASEYTVNGRNLCPSFEAPTCPFDAKGEIKEEFKNLKPRDLL